MPIQDPGSGSRFFIHTGFWIQGSKGHLIPPIRNTVVKTRINRPTYWRRRRSCCTGAERSTAAYSRGEERAARRYNYIFRIRLVNCALLGSYSKSLHVSGYIFCALATIMYQALFLCLSSQRNLINHTKKTFNVTGNVSNSIQ